MHQPFICWKDVGSCGLRVNLSTAAITTTLGAA